MRRLEFLATYVSGLLLVGTTCAQQLCNGHAEYCDRIWSNVSQVGSHDSAFVGDLPTENQFISVADQLALGVRFLQGQTHVEDGTLELCHTSCFEEDAGSVVDYLGTLKTFLDNNPNEVVTLLLTNGDGVDVSMFDDAFNSAAIQSYAYAPSSDGSTIDINSWPTMGDLISQNKRLVFFLDSGADMAKFPYILDEFSYFFETPFDVTDQNFSNCSIDRPAGASAAGRMYIVNHFLDVDVFGSGVLVPDSADINRTNAAGPGAGSIGDNIAECVSMYGVTPKGILLDYIDQGQAIQAENNANNVQ